ncbi:hypothetical protein [Sutcliffiella horikoshii]|nr:hypothetical protein [Sutcliffiella horikoshii]
MSEQKNHNKISPFPFKTTALFHQLPQETTTTTLQENRFPKKKGEFLKE